MGQYHYVVNLTKFEYIHPHRLGIGLKAWEQLGSSASTPQALFALLLASNGRGGGDLEDHPTVGRWAGDRIAVVGDYGANTDLPEEFDAGSIYSRCSDESDTPMEELSRELATDQDPRTAVYKDITPLIRDLFRALYGATYDGSEGWVGRHIPGGVV